MSVPEHTPKFQYGFARRHPILYFLRAILGMALLVFFLEQSTQRIGFLSEVQAVWWPTNGLALALLLRSERRKWPMILTGVLLGSLLGEFYSRIPPANDVVNLVANAAGPLLGALLLPHFEKLETWLREPRLVSRFVGFSLLLAPMVSATIFASYVHLAVHGQGFWSTWLRREVSDMLGYALFTPLVLVVSSRDTYRIDSARTILRTFGLLFLLLVVSGVVFAQTSYALAFVLASVLLLVTLRLRFGASVLGVNLLAAIATAATTHGYGPLVLGGGAVLGPRILLLQSFLTLSMISVLSVSVIQVEREAFQDELRLAYNQMEELATTDPLTEVANRRRFEEVLEIEWARAYRTGNCLAILMIDADDFKAYNDSYGHQAGDDCLRAIANVARGMERRSTDLLARYGGEEFIFLLPTNTGEEAAQVAEKIRSTVETLYEQGVGKLRRKVTISIGCAALVPGPGLASDMLIGASDEALYRAKQKGRNRVELAEKQNAVSSERALRE